MKNLLLCALVLVCGCAGIPTKEANVAMLDTVVKVKVTVKAAVLDDEGEEGRIIDIGGSGSGVIIGKLDDQQGPPQSVIFTAEHVLEDIPKIGEIKEIETWFASFKLKIKSVQITARDRNGKVCDFEPIVHGGEWDKDVAIGVAICDMGQTAEISWGVPGVGSEVTIVGHPAGFEVPILTRGVFSGWSGPFMTVSAGAWPGNSGGPAFHDGKLVGLLVRGSREYHHINLVLPLRELKKQLKAFNKQINE